MQTETGIAVTADNLEVARIGGDDPDRRKAWRRVAGRPRDLAAALEGKLVISLAAGVRLESMEAVAPARFMRVMTNTPSAICRGATAIAPGARTTDGRFGSQPEDIFNAMGVAVEIEEDQIDAVTALAGSGPAFVYTVIEALAEGGSKNADCHRKPRSVSPPKPFWAPRSSPAETGMSPEELRRMVVTPGGTTAAGLAAMEKMNGSKAHRRRGRGRDRPRPRNGEGIFLVEGCFFQRCHLEPRGRDRDQGRSADLALALVAPQAFGSATPSVTGRLSLPSVSTTAIVRSLAVCAARDDSAFRPPRYSWSAARITSSGALRPNQISKESAP